jgi:hypothetical protein
MPDPTQPRRYSADNPFAQQAAPAPTTGGTYSPDNPFAPASTPETPESFGDQAAGFGRALVGQGLLAGFGDEAEGGVRALIDAAKGQPLGASYTRERDAIRAQQAAYAKRHPVISTGAEIAGGLAGALIPVGEVARVAGTGAKIAQAAKIGAVYGGIAGFGKGEGDVASQVGSTASGAALGALMGGAFQGAGSAIGGVARRVTEPPAQRALRQVATAVDRSGTLVEPQPGMVLADALGTPGQRLLDYAVSVPSQGGTEAAEYLLGRAGGRGARLQRGLEGALGTDRGNVVTDAKVLAATTKSHAAHNYGIARDLPPVDDEGVLGHIARDDVLHDALNEARDIMTRVTGQEQPPLTTAHLINGEQIEAFNPQSIAVLDLMKRTLDDVIERRAGSSSSVGRYKGSIIRDELDELLTRLDELRPAYKAARKQFAVDKSIEKALQSGQSARQQIPEQVAADLGGMVPEAQRRFRQGLAQEVWQDVTGKDATGTSSLRYFRQPITRDLFGAAAESPQQGAALQALLDAETRMTQTENTALRNSATARRLMQARDVEGGGLEGLMEPAKAGLSALTGNFAPALQMAAQRGYARVAQGVNERTGNALAALLTAGRNSPQEIADVLQEIAAFNARRVPTRAAGGRVGGRAAGFLLDQGR